MCKRKLLLSFFDHAKHLSAAERPQYWVKTDGKLLEDAKGSATCPIGWHRRSPALETKRLTARRQPMDQR